MTTPKLPPPPRTAQNRSGSVSASARTSRPSAVTSSAASDAVRGEPELAREPAEAAAEGVADDADVGRRACQPDEPVLGRAWLTSSQSTPASTRAVCAAASISIPRNREVLSRIVSVEPQRPRGVAGPLGGDPVAVGACELDDRRDVLGRLGVHHRHGPLVDREVPGQAGLVPVDVARGDDVSGDDVAEGADAGSLLCAGDVGRCHLSKSSVSVESRVRRACSSLSQGPLGPGRLLAGFSRAVIRTAAAACIRPRGYRPAMAAEEEREIWSGRRPGADGWPSSSPAC